MEKLPARFEAKWSDKVLKLERNKGKDAFPFFEEFAEVRYQAVIVVDAMGPLHDPGTWYKVTQIGMLVAQWDFQNKAIRTNPP